MSHIFMFIASFLAGSAVSAGTFAFIIVIGIMPRILRKSKMTDVLFLENVIIAGVIAGNLLSLWDKKLFTFPYLVGHLIVVVYGVCTGMFVGCMSVALAEILHTFPIIFRRTKLKIGLSAVVYAMAAGKLLGSLFYFVMGYFRTA
ncbi:MAG: stage V sporulation protein AB [Agathobacter sp.]|nr:stage V sporulation protein AB [Agathobacter sp.]